MRRRKHTHEQKAKGKIFLLVTGHSGGSHHSTSRRRRGRAPEARNVALQQALAAVMLEALALARKPLDVLPHAFAERRDVALHPARQALAAIGPGDR